MPALLALLLIAAGTYLYVDSLSMPDQPEGVFMQATGYQNGQPFGITLQSIGGGHWLTPAAATAFTMMRNAAASAGVTLNVDQSFRTMAQQQSLFSRLGSYRDGGLASASGNSPHQRGIAVDLDVGQNARGLPGTNDAWAWLSSNALTYGFINDYTTKGGTGEAWHFQTVIG